MQDLGLALPRRTSIYNNNNNLSLFSTFAESHGKLINGPPKAVVIQAQTFSLSMEGEFWYACQILFLTSCRAS